MLPFPPRGLIANLVTPLDEAGRPDPRGFGRLIDRLKNHVAGFLCSSLVVGEGLALPPEDRLSLLDMALTVCPPEKTLFFEITGRDPGRTRDLLQAAEQRAAPSSPNLFYLLTPLVYHGNRDLPDHIRALLNNRHCRLILGNDPRLVGRVRSRIRHRNIRTSVLKKTVTNEQIVGLAYDGDLDRVLNYQRALKNRSGFRLYDLNEFNFLERPSSAGLVSGGACLLPQTWSDVVNSSLNLFDAHRFFPDHLSRIWESGTAVRALGALGRPNPPAVIKTGLEAIGVLDNGRLAPESPGLTEKQRKELIPSLRRIVSMEL